MRTSILAIVATVVVLAFAATWAQDDEKPFAASELEAIPAEIEIPPPAEDPWFRYEIQEPLEPRRTIRTGGLRIEVEDVLIAVETARAIADEVGATVARRELIQAGDRGREANLLLRVPPDAFDEVVRGLSRLGRVVHSTMNEADVTWSYVDIETRLAVQEEMVRRMRELAGRGGDLEDLLAAERELARALEELESLKARIRTYDRRLTEAELRVLLLEPGSRAGTGALRPVTGTMRRITHAFATSSARVLGLLVAGLPWGLVGLLVYWVARRRT